DEVGELVAGGEVAKLLVWLGGVADGQGVDRVDDVVVVGEDPPLVQLRHKVVLGHSALVLQAVADQARSRQRVVGRAQPSERPEPRNVLVRRWPTTMLGQRAMWRE